MKSRWWSNFPYARSSCVRGLRVVVCGLAAGGAASAATVVEVGDTVEQAGVERFGIGLAQHNYYDSAQMMKELLFRNPGFEGLLYQSVVRLGGNSTASLALSDAADGQWPTGFWANAGYEIVYSPTALGRNGTLQTSIAPNRVPTPNDPAGSTQGTTYVFQDPVGPVASSGDYLLLRKTFRGEAGGEASGSWTVSAGSGSSVNTEFADLPVGTDGEQCVRLTGAGGNSTAMVRGEFDTLSGFVTISGNHTLRFKAKCVSGNPQISVAVRRNTTAYFLNPAYPVSSGWAEYAIPVSAQETGTGLGSLSISFTTTGTSTVLLDDVSFRKDGGDPTNTTEFRDEVVASLRGLQPGILRYVNWQNLGDSLDNSLAPVFGRKRSGYRTAGTTENNMMPGLHEFLVLCAHIGADPWFCLPVTFSPAETANLVEYLGGDATTPYGGIRAARGQTAPWTSVFTKIHLEFGNENWNNSAYRGGCFSDYPACAARATVLFSAIKTSPHYSPEKFRCVLGGQAGNPFAAAQLHNASPLHDHFTVAPYMSGNVTTYELPNGDVDTESLFGALFAEPEWWSYNPSQSTGLVRQLFNSVQGSSRPVPISIYEVNLHTTDGTIEQHALDAYTPSLGAGLAVADHMLTMLKTSGIREQVFFSLPGHQFSFSGNRTAALWGIQRDFGPTNRKRPHYFAQQMLNNVLAGDLLTTTHSGDNPTWTVSGINRVTFTDAHFIKSYAFRDGNRRALVLMNLHREFPLEVSFAGPNAPGGNVTYTRLTSTEVTDNNELADVVSPVTGSFQALDPDTPMSLPPFSMTVLTWEPTARSAWRYQNFGTVSEAGPGADLEDPDEDGVPNFLEYALGRDPLAGETVPTTRIEEGSGGGTEFVFERTRSELTYTVEMSDDLISWTPQTPNPGSPGSVVRIPLDPGADGKSFARLRVRDEGI